MLPRRKQTARSFPYQDKFELEFGLRMTARDENKGVVQAVVCRFCECWGREVADYEVADGRKRKRTTNNKHWKYVSHSDNIRKHMQEQHPKKFEEYEALRKLASSTPEVLKGFFEQSTVGGDFSLMCYRRNSYCSSMTDLALEGIMYAKQYSALWNVAKHL